MNRNEEKQIELRKRIEAVSGIEPKTPQQFDSLATSILTRTKQRMSSTTLKRFWGYIEKGSDSQIRSSTLDILAQYVGYVSWKAFCGVDEAVVSSDFLAAKRMQTSELEVFTIIRLLWEPNRCVSIRYEGSDLFTVVESINSKLTVGDTFHCSGFVENQSLIMTELSHHGMPPCSYICGKAGGIKFEIM